MLTCRSLDNKPHLATLFPGLRFSQLQIQWAVFTGQSWRRFFFAISISPNDFRWDFRPQSRKKNILFRTYSAVSEFLSLLRKKLQIHTFFPDLAFHNLNKCCTQRVHWPFNFHFLTHLNTLIFWYYPLAFSAEWPLGIGKLLIHKLVSHLIAVLGGGKMQLQLQFRLATVSKPKKCRKKC